MKNVFSVLGLLAVLTLFACVDKNKTTGSNNPIYAHQSVKPLTEQIAADPQNASLYFQRGKAIRKIGGGEIGYDSLAIADFKMAATLDSSKSEYFSAVGDLLFEHQDVSGSLPWLEYAIKLNPEDKQAQLKIAKMFVYLKDYPKAFAAINTVLRQDVYNPEGYFLKGMIYKDMKDTSRAISSFQTAVQVAPDYYEAIVQLGLVYGLKHDPLALQYFNNAFKLDSTDAFPLYARGIFYQDQEKYEEAKAEYRNTILHDRQYGDAYFNIGYILMQQDSLEKARHQFDLVTKIDPSNPRAYYNRGLCSEMMGDKATASADYKQALVFDEEYAEAKAGLQRVGN